MRRRAPKTSTATTGTISRVNSTAIIDVLREHGELSRQQIGAKTGLSPATVNRLTAALIDEGLVAPAGHMDSTGGRPSILLTYTGGSRLVACIQVRAEGARGALVNFDSEIVHRADVSFDGLASAAGNPADAGTGAEQDPRLSRTLELFDTLIATAADRGTPCVSAGVSVPGVVQQPSGRITNLPELGWPEVRLQEMLARRVDIPVVVENDANALAFGELNYGVGQGVKSLVAVHLENGLGAGIISNGQIHHGFQHEAGEIGYLLMEPSSLEHSFPLMGDLEDRVGSVALTRTARARGLDVPDGHILLAEEIFRRAAGGEEIPAQMASEILDMVAMAIGAMSIILDPELVVLGSGLARHAQMAIPEIEKRLTGRIIRVPRMEAASLIEDAVLVGVAELAAREVRELTYVAN